MMTKSETRPGKLSDLFLPRRLDKFLSDATSLSRTQAIAAWRAGRVEVKPVQADNLGVLIFGDDVVFLDGVEIRPTEPSVYVALNKPSGIISAARDPYGKPSLEPWLADLPDGVFPVGRLDKETTGFLLLTDDGNLAQMLLHPDRHVPKAYTLTLADDIQRRPDALSAFRDGMQMVGGEFRAVSMEVMRSDPTGSECRLVIDEGRKRIIRKACATLGLNLIHLHRDQIANVELGSVEPGEVRALSSVEIERLWGEVGGRQKSLKLRFDALLSRSEYLESSGRPDARLTRFLEKSQAQVVE